MMVSKSKIRNPKTYSNLKNNLQSKNNIKNWSKIENILTTKDYGKSFLFSSSFLVRTFAQTHQSCSVLNKEIKINRSKLYWNEK